MDFPKIRKQELFYSYVLRYHRYSGNRMLSSSFREFFDVDRNMNSVLFPQKIGNCLEQLRIEKHEYLKYHSAMPYYQIFLQKADYKIICNEIFYGDKAYTAKILTQQRVDSSIKSDRIYYCPRCMKEKPDYSGIRTSHQIHGVYVCHRHHCHLKSIPVFQTGKIVDLEHWDMDMTACEPGGVLEQIAEDVDYIIEHAPGIDNYILRKQLFDEALLRGAFRFGKWQDTARENEWMHYYENLPEQYTKYRSRVDFKRYAAHQLSGGIDPIEYLLFIRSLFGGFEKYMKTCFG